MVVRELRSVDAGGKGRAGGLLDHSRPGEADRRAARRGAKVGEGRVRRVHAAGGRVAEDRERQQPGVGVTARRLCGARHLHQRHHPFLHARPARRGHDDDR